MEGLVKGSVEVEGSMDSLIDSLMEGFTEDFVALVGVIVALGVLEGLEGLEDCRILSLKWVIGFFERVDLRSIGSVMIIKFKALI